MDYIDLNGTLRKEYRNDGMIAVHFDFMKEAHGTLTVSRDDEPILNDILQMLKSRDDRITLMDETIRDVDNALRYGHDLTNDSHKEIYEESTGYAFKNATDEKDARITELNNEIAALQSRLNQLYNAMRESGVNQKRTTRRRRAA